MEIEIDRTPVVECTSHCVSDVVLVPTHERQVAVVDDDHERCRARYRI